MTNPIEELEDNTEFQEFINKEFDNTAVHSSIEEMAEFAFGSLQEAVEAFDELKG